MDDLPLNQSDTTPRPGEDLYGLSVEELKSRISLYREEVERLTKALAKKEQELNAADLLFKPKT